MGRSVSESLKKWNSDPRSRAAAPIARVSGTNVVSCIFSKGFISQRRSRLKGVGILEHAKNVVFTVSDRLFQLGPSRERQQLRNDSGE